MRSGVPVSYRFERCAGDIVLVQDPVSRQSQYLEIQLSREQRRVLSVYVNRDQARSFFS